MPFSAVELSVWTSGGFADSTFGAGSGLFAVGLEPDEAVAVGEGVVGGANEIAGTETVALTLGAAVLTAVGVAAVVGGALVTGCVGSSFACCRGAGFAKGRGGASC